jgi:hypothetical protein
LLPVLTSDGVSIGSIMLEPLIIDNEICGALLVAWRRDGEPFDVRDEEAIHDFSVIFAASHKLLNTVEELATAVELELAIPRSSIPAFSALASSPTNDKPTSPNVRH